jgi:ERO1-like protein beta
MFAPYVLLFVFTSLSNQSTQISPKAIVSDACASYSTLDTLNRDLRPSLIDITNNTDFFAYYRLNLYGKECPFWSDEDGTCANIACAVNTLDNEDDIPLVWRAEELGKLEGPKAGHPGKQLQEERGPEKPLQGMLGDDVGESCVVEYDDECDDRDYCVPEDEGAASKGSYVSLVDNPERFTGYAGEGAQKIWKTIYRENCFSKASFPKSASLGPPPFFQQGPAAHELQSVLKGAGDPLEDDLDGQCLEKRVFYRVISGMHASVSTHLCWDYLNKTTGKWEPNVACYKERLHPFPDRVSNLYFNYALVLRAVTKLAPYLQDYTFCSGDPIQDRSTKAKIQAFTTKTGTAPQIFDESLMFVNGEGPSLKEDFRNRFRNVSRLMDCVGCDKCRLWGKLQTAGYGAALKVLFEFDNNSEHVPKLKRTELVALFNTLSRISSSLEAINGFRIMVESQETEAESVGHHHVMPDRITKPHNVVPEKVLNKKSSEKTSAEQEFEDLEREIRERKTRPPQGFKEEFWTEIDLIWRVTKYVIQGWIRFPKDM